MGYWHVGQFWLPAACMPLLNAGLGIRTLEHACSHWIMSTLGSTAGTDHVYRVGRPTVVMSEVFSDVWHHLCYNMLAAIFQIAGDISLI
jgi:hypothetical protein